MKRYIHLGLLIASLGLFAETTPKPDSTKPAWAPKKAETPAATNASKPPPTPAAAVNAPAAAKDMVATPAVEPAFKGAEGQTRSTVIKFDKRRHRASINDDPYHTWQRKDSVCIFRGTRAMACGKVIAVGIKGAVVQITQQTSQGAVKPGDEARYYEPEKKMPEITDEELASETLMEGKPYTYNVTLGYSLSLDIMFPVAHFYWSVSPTIAIGIQPAYISKTGTTADSKLSGFGGMLTASYFGDEHFRGMWIMLGSGFYRLSANNATLTEQTNYPILQGTFGWREDWAHGLNVAAAAGIRFLSPLTAVIPEVAYPSIAPIVLLEVGISF